MGTILIKNGIIVDTDHEYRANLQIDGEKIVAITDQLLPADESIETHDQTAAGIASCDYAFHSMVMGGGHKGLFDDSISSSFAISVISSFKRIREIQSSHFRSVFNGLNRFLNRFFNRFIED